MIRKQTWAVVILTAMLVGFAIYLDKQKEALSSAEATPSSEPISLLNPDEGLPTSIEVISEASDTVKLARNQDNVWALVLPQMAEANQSTAEAAATQLSALKVVTEVQGKTEIFGLDKPVYVITVELDGGKTHTLEVGDNTPTNNGYYIRLDKKRMLVVGLSGIDALTNLVNFPPYLSTPTPSPLPATETPLPASTPAGTETNSIPAP